MKIVIVEDEPAAVRQLKRLIQRIEPTAEIIAHFDSVEIAVEWFKNHASPDLAFFDIQLSDGLSFEIFEQVTLTCPIIFTTAFDNYALQAFKVNSIDYLLKPIDPEAMERALCKYQKYHQRSTPSIDNSAIEKLLQSMTKKEYKERFLVKIGQQLTYLLVKDIAYFYSEDGLIFACQKNGKRHNLDYTLDQLSTILNPDDFFRINRKILIQLPAIQKIHTYFNSRLKLELNPNTELETIVSRDRVSDFKKWLDK